MQCDRCKKVFRDNYLLNRHLNKKNICRKIEEEEDEIVECNDDYKCKYCCKEFAVKRYCKDHEKTCKLKDDPVRILEIDLNIKLSKYYDKECRFCDRTFTRHYSLTKHYLICKKRYEYIDKLKDKKKSKEIIHIKNIYNTTNNNNNTTNNNNTLVVNSYEDTERIMRLEKNVKRICKYLRYDQMQFGSDPIKWKTPQKLLLDTHGNRDKSNANLRVTNERRSVIGKWSDGECKESPAMEVLLEIFESIKQDIDCSFNEFQEMYMKEGMTSKLERMRETMTTQDYIQKHMKDIMLYIKQLIDKKYTIICRPIQEDEE